MTCPLTILAIVNHSTAPIAPNRSHKFLPNITINKIIKIINGSPYRTSTILIIIESTFPPAYPAIIPHETPITKATPVATKPTSKEILAPYKILLNKSLPKTSVPRIWAADGGDAPNSRFWNE